MIDVLIKACHLLYRFSASSCKSIKAHILQVITDHLGRPNMPLDNIPRNMLKFLTTSVGLPELRLLVAQRIESWIQNPKVRTSYPIYIILLLFFCSPVSHDL